MSTCPRLTGRLVRRPDRNGGLDPLQVPNSGQLKRVRAFRNVTARDCHGTTQSDIRAVHGGIERRESDASDATQATVRARFDGVLSCVNARRARKVPDMETYEVVYRIDGVTYFETRETFESAQWVESVVHGHGGAALGIRTIPTREDDE